FFLTHLIKMGAAGRVINLRNQNIILTNRLRSVINVYFYPNPLFLYAFKYTLTALTVGKINVILTSH
ncbi:MULTISPECIES: hypothetical protein, partial [unclassified Citrobacter]|uniref:hypothetical protein n=1 Tax=unclassified Citrobacter TaxID=2644389 RepID=UPI002303C60C